MRCSRPALSGTATPRDSDRRFVLRSTPLEPCRAESRPRGRGDLTSARSVTKATTIVHVPHAEHRPPKATTIVHVPHAGHRPRPVCSAPKPHWARSPNTWRRRPRATVHEMMFLLAVVAVAAAVAFSSARLRSHRLLFLLVLPLRLLPRGRRWRHGPRGIATRRDPPLAPPTPPRHLRTSTGHSAPTSAHKATRAICAPRSCGRPRSAARRRHPHSAPRAGSTHPEERERARKTKRDGPSTDCFMKFL